MQSIGAAGALGGLILCFGVSRLFGYIAAFALALVGIVVIFVWAYRVTIFEKASK